MDLYIVHYFLIISDISDKTFCRGLYPSKYVHVGKIQSGRMGTSLVGSRGGSCYFYFHYRDYLHY